MTDNKYLTEDEELVLHPENLTKYKKAKLYSENHENARDWSYGHKLLVELGWTRTKRDVGVRSFVSVKKPDNLDYLNGPVVARNKFDKKVDAQEVFNALETAQQIVGEWLTPGRGEVMKTLTQHAMFNIKLLTGFDYKPSVFKHTPDRRKMSLWAKIKRDVGYLKIKE